MSDYTILLIDYEPRSIESTCRALVRAGYRVEVAKDGISGIELFHSLKPDITLIEAMLPKRHGFEVCLELKSTEHGKQSAVVIITSVYRGRRYRIQAKHHYKCDGYLEKPVSDELLLSTVEELLATVASDAAGPAEAATPPDDAPSIAPTVDRTLPPSGPDTPVDSLAGGEEQSTIDPNRIVSIEAGRPRSGKEASPSTTAMPTVAGGGGGAQPAYARLTSPGADPSSEPRVDRLTPETAHPSSLPGKRGRALLWIAFALLAALAGLLLAIIVV